MLRRSFNDKRRLFWVGANVRGIWERLHSSALNNFSNISRGTPNVWFTGKVEGTLSSFEAVVLGSLRIALGVSPSCTILLLVCWLEGQRPGSALVLEVYPLRLIYS